MSYILVIGGGKDSIFLIEKIHKAGLKAIVVDRNPEALAFNVADKKLILSTHNSKPIIDSIKEDILAVVTRSSGIPVITAAEISESLGLKGTGTGAAKRLTNKDNFAGFCKEFSIESAKKYSLNDIGAINFPCVIKPALETVGKKGVRLVQNKEKLPEMLQDIKKYSSDGEILIQEYIAGKDVSVISIVYDNKLYPYFFLRELNEFDTEGKINFGGFKLFTEISEDEKRKIIDIAEKIVQHSNIGFSPFLVSFKLNSEKAIAIEVNLDFGGEGVLEQMKNKDLIGDFINSIIKKEIPKN